MVFVRFHVIVLQVRRANLSVKGIGYIDAMDVGTSLQFRVAADAEMVGVVSVRVWAIRFVGETECTDAMVADIYFLQTAPIPVEMVAVASVRK